MLYSKKLCKQLRITHSIRNLSEDFMEKITPAQVNGCNVPIREVIITNSTGDIISGALLSGNIFTIPASLGLPQGKYKIKVIDFAGNIGLKKLIVSKAAPRFSNWSLPLLEGNLYADFPNLLGFSVTLNEVCVDGVFVPFKSLSITGINGTHIT